MAEPSNENSVNPAQDYLASHGLSHEPFTADITSAAFFPGATREQRLNLLLHLVPLGEALLITGVSGVGKRTLLSQFVARAQESWRLCRIDAAAGLDSNSLLQQLAHCFAPDAESQPDRQESERMVVGQIQGLRKSAQQPIMLIENGEQISESGFRALSKFIANETDEEKLLGVVIFGLPGIEEKLNNPALQSLRAQIKHTFELPLLSEEETAAYLDHRIRSAGLLGDSPYSEAVSRAIYNASNGLPRKINELAQAVLLNKREDAPQDSGVTSDDQSPVDSKFRKYLLPRNLWPFAVAALLGGVLFFQERINSLFEAPPETSSTRVAQVEPEPQVQQRSQGSDARGDEQVVADEFTQQEEGAAAVAEPEPEPAVAADNSSPEVAVEKMDLEPEVADKGLSVAELVSELPELEVTQSEASQAEEVVQAPEPEPKKESQIEMQSRPPEAEAPQSDWVTQQLPDDYTLQLVAQEQEAKREKFLTRFGIEDSVERFSTSKKGRRWYVAAFGVYSSRTAALEASRQLPEGVVPWVRSFGSIQRELWQSAAEPHVDSPEVASKPAVEGPVLSEQEQWVMARPPEHFVLQLVAFEQASKTRDFIKNHSLEGVVKEVRLINRSKVWHVAVYGDATDRREAQLLVDNLNKNNKVTPPWVRTFGSLQAAMREFQQQ